MPIMDITDQVIAAIQEYADTLPDEQSLALKALAESMAPHLITSLGLEQFWVALYQMPNGELDEDSDYDTRREVIAAKVELGREHARDHEQFFIGSRLITPLEVEVPAEVPQELVELVNQASEQ